MQMLGLPLARHSCPGLSSGVLLTLQALNIFIFKVIDAALTRMMFVANMGWKQKGQNLCLGLRAQLGDPGG